MYSLRVSLLFAFILISTWTICFKVKQFLWIAWTRYLLHETKIHKMVFMIKLLFRIVRAITLFALCGFAVFLTFEIFLQFQSKDSSFKKSQVPISTLPSISICFDPKNKNLLEYGKDFNISKYNNNNDYLGMAQFRFLILLKNLFLTGSFYLWIPCKSFNPQYPKILAWPLISNQFTVHWNELSHCHFFCSG